MRAKPCLSINAFLLISLTFALLHVRSAGFGWMGMDDVLLLRQNLNLGGSLLSRLVSSVPDVTFGRRFTPILWAYAALWSGCTGLGYHIGTLVSGLAMTLSGFYLLKSQVRESVALVAALLFVSSPMRCETFDWAIGFVYNLTATLLIWGLYFALRERWTLSVLFAGASALVYPQAAGGILVVCWMGRKRLQCALLLVFLFLLALIQYYLRAKVGFIPMKYDFGAALWAFPHYLTMLVLPLADVPLVAPGFHWYLLIGAFGFVFWAAVKPQHALVTLVFFLPTIAAAVTESFWYGARYEIFIALPVLYFGALYIDRLPRVRWFWPVVAIVFSGGLTLLNSGFVSLNDCKQRAAVENILLYGKSMNIESIEGYK